MQYRYALFAAALVAAACTAAPDPMPSPRPSLVLDLPRAVHRASALPGGRVLLTGGCTAPGCAGAEDARRTEVYAAGAITPGPRLHTARLSHTATPLPDGAVLVAGGYPGEGAPPTASVELVDLTRDTAAEAGSLRVARADHTATLLPDGTVLIAGGRGTDGRALRSAEILDPATGDSQLITALPTPRTAALAVRVGDRVLITGGTADSERAVSSTVYYDPAAQRWTPGPHLLRARVKHAAVPLADGTVLVAGGAAGVETRDRFADTEVLRPGATHFIPGPELTDGRYKLADAAGVLADGRIVIGGGPTLDVLDLASGRTSVVRVAGLTERLSFQTVTVLPGSRVLVAGGYDDAIVPQELARVVRVP